MIPEKNGFVENRGENILVSRHLSSIQTGIKDKENF
jgi:hypothetical protein